MQVTFRPERLGVTPRESARFKHLESRQSSETSSKECGDIVDHDNLRRQVQVRRVPAETRRPNSRISRRLHTFFSRASIRVAGSFTGYAPFRAEHRLELAAGGEIGWRGNFPSAGKRWRAHVESCAVAEGRFVRAPAPGNQ